MTVAAVGPCDTVFGGMSEAGVIVYWLREGCHKIGQAIISASLLMPAKPALKSR
jgi:hypothetical protein